MFSFAIVSQQRHDGSSSRRLDLNTTQLWRNYRRQCKRQTIPTSTTIYAPLSAHCQSLLDASFRQTRQTRHPMIPIVQGVSKEPSIYLWWCPFCSATVDPAAPSFSDRPESVMQPFSSTSAEISRHCCPTSPTLPTLSLILLLTDPVHLATSIEL